MGYVQNWPITHARATVQTSGNPLVGTPVVGNTIIVPIKYGSGAAQSVLKVEDAYGNTYVQDAHGTTNGNGDNCEVWSCKSIATTGAAFTIKVTMTGLIYNEFGAMEWSGLAGTLSGTSTGTSGVNSTPPNVTLTTTDANALVIVVCAAEQLTAITAPSGFTSFDQQTANGADMDGQAAYKSFAITQSGVTYTWSGIAPAAGTSWATCAVAYKIGLLVAGGGMSGMSGMSGLSGIF